MITRGSQNRYSLLEVGLHVVERLDDDHIVLEDIEGNQELYVLRDDHAGYVVEIDGLGYEYVRRDRAPTCALSCYDENEVRPLVKRDESTCPHCMSDDLQETPNGVHCIECGVVVSEYEYGGDND